MTGLDQNRAAGRAPELGATCVLAERLRLLWNREALPDLSTGRSVQCDNASAETAAFVVWERARSFLAGRHRDIQSPAMQHGRSGQSGRGMVLDAYLPQQPASHRIYGVRVPAGVTEIGPVASRFAGPDAADVDSGADDRPGVERPVDAASPCVERVHVAGDTADEDSSADHRERRPRLHVTGEAEGPLQLEPRHIRSREPCARRLEPGIREVLSKAVPGGLRRVDRKRPARPAHRVRRRLDRESLPERLAARKLGERPSLRRRPAMCHRHHRSELEHLKDSLRRHRAKHVEPRCAVDGSVVTAVAVFRVERLAILRQRGSRDTDDQDGHQKGVRPH